MQFISFTSNDRASWGLLEGDEIRDVGSQADGSTLADVLRHDGLEEALSRKADAPTLRRNRVELLPPVTDPQKIICVGLNYADHIAEMKRETPKFPVIFARYPDSLVGSGTALVAPKNSTHFDYEGEFCVVIGREARHVSSDDAAKHVLGYTIMNDGSVRDYQRHTHQFTPGKNFPGSGALGPAIVTADEFGEIGAQKIRTRVNDEIVQDSSLNQLVFGVSQLISYCSEWTTLRPGDLIATGTPGGVGDGHHPARWLTPGDTVAISIESIGTLTNTITKEH